MDVNLTKNDIIRIYASLEMGMETLRMLIQQETDEGERVSLVKDLAGLERTADRFRASLTDAVMASKDAEEAKAEPPVLPVAPEPVEAAPQRQLTAMDRCDQCGAQAYVQATVAAGPILFCAHHGTKYEEGIIAKGGKITIDERKFVNA